MASYAVTGTSRGLGLEFVAQLATNPQNRIFALARNPEGSQRLQKLVKAHSNVVPVKVDITNKADWTSAAEIISQSTGGTLDVLIHNALAVDLPKMMAPLYGAAEETTVMQTAIADSINDNVLTMIEGTNKLLPLIFAGKQKKVIVISSAMALPELVVKSELPFAVPYAATKAAMNLVVAKYAAELKPKGVRFLSVSPGWVDTQEASEANDMVDAFLLEHFKKYNPAASGKIQPEQSVRECLHTIQNFGDDVNGLMVASKGDQEWLHI